MIDKDKKTDIRKKIDNIRERIDNGNYGRMYGAKETSDERLKIIYAELRDGAPGGSVPDKDSWVKKRPEYLKAVEDKADAYANWKTAETFMKIAFVEFDIWRSEEATNRGLDRR